MKEKYPDPAERQFVRVNGELTHQATAGNPELRQAITDLKNWEVRQAAINAGIDVGQRHVGSRMGLGEEQISRQALLDQMIQRGVKPEQIPGLARPPAAGQYEWKKPMRIPESVLPDQKNNPVVHHHELGHSIVGGLNGVEQGGIITHKHPILRGSGGVAAALMNHDNFVDPATGDFDPVRIAENFDVLMETAAGGVAANEVVDGIPRANNPGMFGDRRKAVDLMRAASIPKRDWEDLWNAAVDRAVEKLQHSAEIIRDEASRREDDLPVSWHYSKERVQGIVERVKREGTPQRALERAGQQQLFNRGGTAEALGGNAAPGAGTSEGEGAGVGAAPTQAKLNFPYKEKEPSKLPGIPGHLHDLLEPDEQQWLAGRNLLQRNITKAFRELDPSIAEMKNNIRAGHGFSGWWQRFIDSFEALGQPTEAAEIREMGPSHAEALKAFHSALSGNKAVEVANRMGWMTYRDWLEAGRPTDERSVMRIVRQNGGMRNLDGKKIFNLVNSPQFQESVPFHGQAFVGSPMPGSSSGAHKIPSMGATVAGKGNLSRVVNDTHMMHVYGLNKMNSDAEYLALSMHVRQAAAELGLKGGEGQEQVWGTILALKQLMGEGATPGQAAAKFSKDVLGQVGKDYVQVILESMDKDPDVRQAMEDLKKYGFDPGGPAARMELEAIAKRGQQQLQERQRPGLSRGLLEKSARRIQGAMEEKRERLQRRRGG